MVGLSAGSKPWEWDLPLTSFGRYHGGELLSICIKVFLRKQFLPVLPFSHELVSCVHYVN